jgi:hypothetical protein
MMLATGIGLGTDSQRIPTNGRRIVSIGRMTAASRNALAIEMQVSYAATNARLRSPTG